MATPGYESVQDLPEKFPIFPLPGVLLFPRGVLPLNIFEPRYLNMVDDAMAGDGMIGMVQARKTGPKHHPDIMPVGCLGRISEYSETNDGRYLITLEGICRFEITEEASFVEPYRQALPKWTRFGSDLHPPETENVPSRERILDALRNYLEKTGMQADWHSAKSASMESLINALCAACPFSIIEKQALLEAENLKQRGESLITLLEIDSQNPGNSKWLQ